MEEERPLSKDEITEEEARRIIEETTGRDPENPTDEEIIATRAATRDLAEKRDQLEADVNANRTKGDIDSNKENTYEKD